MEMNEHGEDPQGIRLFHLLLGPSQDANDIDVGLSGAVDYLDGSIFKPAPPNLLLQRCAEVRRAIECFTTLQSHGPLELPPQVCVNVRVDPRSRPERVSAEHVRVLRFLAPDRILNVVA